MTQAETRAPTWEMVFIHDQFRREYGMLPELIRGVAAGDRDRATIVGTHAQLYTDLLHHHHAAEDKRLWPRLLARCSDQLDQDLIHRMETQHERVAELIERIKAVLPRWVSSAGETDRDRLAQLYEQLRQPLFEHLAEEEERILPLAEQHVTAAEWEEMGKDAQRSIPMRKAMLVIGSMLDNEGPNTARFYAMLPLPLRAAYRFGGRRSYDRYMRTLRGA